MMVRFSLNPLIDRFMHAVAAPDESEQDRLSKAVLVFLAVMTGFAGLLWTVMYAAFGLPYVALLPLAHTIVSILGMLYVVKTKRYRVFMYVELSSLMLLPFGIHWMIGSFAVSGAVMIWAVLSPLAALMFDTGRFALAWFLVFLCLLVVSGFIDPLLRRHAVVLPQPLVVLTFVMDFVGVSIVFFMLMRYFVRALRELQVKLMHQEKMAALGTLAAGVAHELNNPAAAVQRGVTQLRDALSPWEHWTAELRTLALEPQQTDLIQSLEAARLPPARNMAYQQEDEVLEWLEDHAVDRAWELAPGLVSAGWSLRKLEQLEQALVPAQLAVVVAWIVARSSVHELLDEVKLGATQVSELVKSVKAYSYLDQGPIQRVDLHESLDNTLVMLQYKLKAGVTITQEYGSDIPCVEARGSQLNQVWTNLLDNAIDAMEGQGTITIRTACQKRAVVVDIIDTGPGIPAHVQPHIFEPFFTTKGPGSGSGLGLYIVYDIVRKQGGHIQVTSNPGGTHFQVTLPRDVVRDPGNAPPAETRSI